MSDYYDFEEDKKSIHAGFRYGFTGGIIMVVVHLILLLIFQGSNSGDWIAFLLGWIVYFFLGQSAAETQYEQQKESLDATRGVRAAGVGAALVTSIIVWIYIIIRGIVRDAFGVFVLAEPISLFCAITVEVLIAMAIGSWSGGIIEKKYKIDLEY